MAGHRSEFATAAASKQSKHGFPPSQPEPHPELQSYPAGLDFSAPR